VVKFLYGWLPFEHNCKSDHIKEKKNLQFLKKWVYILHNENNIIKNSMKAFLNAQILYANLNKMIFVKFQFIDHMLF